MMDVGEHCVEVQVAFAVDLPCVADDASKVVDLLVVHGLGEDEAGTGVALADCIAAANVSSAESFGRIFVTLMKNIL